VCRPGGYLAYGITHALVYSVALLLASCLAPWAWGMLAATLAIRTVTALFSERVALNGGLPWWAFGLLPVKDLCSFALWLASFLGSRVTWGERTFLVTREGRLVPD
jgi:ceramide glucosyltransferase